MKFQHDRVHCPYKAVDTMLQFPYRLVKKNYINHGLYHTPAPIHSF
jgi:hypothetical protein